MAKKFPKGSRPVRNQAAVPNGGRKGSGLKPPVASGITPPKAVSPAGNATAVVPTASGQPTPMSGGTMDWFKKHLAGGVLR